MNLFRKIFKRETHAEKLRRKREEQLPADELFAQRFTEKGGKFIYCTSEIEVQEAFRSILKELGLYVKTSSNASPTIEAMFEEHTSFFSFPTTDSNVYLTDCEYLITSLGGIMFTSLQMKHRKMNELPDTFIVFAKTSQMVKDISEGMRGLNKRYPANQKPTGLVTLQSFFEDPEKSSIATYGTSNKKTYLILLEDLTN